KAPRLEDAAAARQLQERLSAVGVAPARVRLLGTSSQEEHLRTYCEADLVLDPMPHGGGISTGEALFMGLPVLTLLGDTPAARVSAAVMAAAGLDGWSARSDAEYVRLGVQATHDLPRLAAIRASLREQAAKSVLGDTQRYCAAVGATYRELWRRYCA